MEKKTKTKKTRKLSKKEGYKKSKEILEALEDNDKESLNKTNYVCYDNIIEFPQPCAFTLKRLKEIIKDAENYQKTNGKGMVIGMEIKISTMDMDVELKNVLKKNNGRKFIATKTKVLK